MQVHRTEFEIAAVSPQRNGDITTTDGENYRCVFGFSPGDRVELTVREVEAFWHRGPIDPRVIVGCGTGGALGNVFKALTLPGFEFKDGQMYAMLCRLLPGPGTTVCPECLDSFTPGSFSIADIHGRLAHPGCLGEMETGRSL